MNSVARTPPSPLLRLMAAAHLRRVDVASRAGVSMRVVAVLARNDPVEVLTLGLDRVARVAIALGCAPAELVPILARRPRKVLLYDRGVFQLKR